jgi:NAD(P)-dependent dehydrogenase (short-subunit alcohol dehydrogenase family)
MTASLENKVCLITGASGIAAATARMAVQSGAQVFFVSDIEEQCRALAESLSALNSSCGYHVADLTVADEARETVARCVEQFGRIDALFNVVGISGRKFGDGPVHECSDEGWTRTMQTNVNTAFLMSREVIRVMLHQQPDDNGLRGAILNMSSVLAFAPASDHFATHAYAASKGAIISLTKAMASYYAPHKIRVNALAPGLTRTPMSARAQSDRASLDFIKTRQPLSEDLIEAEDVARAALFLLSDEARYITGEVITVDAGWSVS